MTHMNKNISLNYKNLLLKILGLWVGLLILFCGANLLIKRINNDNLRKNALKSELILEKEGNYARPVFDNALFQKDNFTDAIMISTSAYRTPESDILIDGLANPYYYSAGNDSTTQQATISGLQGKEYETCYYGRYWHGYNLTLIPLLSVMDIKDIRILNYVILIILAIVACALMWRKIKPVVSLFFIISLLVTAYPIVPLSFQFSTCYYITFIVSILLLIIPVKKLKDETCGIIFFITGAVTSYFDLLTTPLLTFGITSTILLLRRKRLPDWKIYFTTAICWGIGYAGLWASKWVLASLYTPIDFIYSASTAISQRGSSILTEPGIFTKDKILLAIIFIMLIVGGITLVKYTKGKRRTQALHALPIGITALLPMIWMLLIQNHSIVHFWFVWRIIGITVFCSLIFLYLCVKTRGFHAEDSRINTLL